MFRLISSRNTDLYADGMDPKIERKLRDHIKTQYPEISDRLLDQQVEEYRAVAHLILRLAVEDVEREESDRSSSLLTASECQYRMIITYERGVCVYKSIDHKTG